MARELTLVDCGLGPIGNVRRALQQIGANPTIAEESDAVARARMLVLPAYGGLSTATDELCRGPLADAIRMVIQRGDPVLAIGTGMHLLFAGDGKGRLGLEILEGKTVALPAHRTDAERKRAGRADDRAGADKDTPPLEKRVDPRGAGQAEGPAQGRSGATTSVHVRTPRLPTPSSASPRTDASTQPPAGGAGAAAAAAPGHVRAGPTRPQQQGQTPASSSSDTPHTSSSAAIGPGVGPAQGSRSGESGTAINLPPSGSNNALQDRQRAQTEAGTGQRAMPAQPQHNRPQPPTHPAAPPNPNSASHAPPTLPPFAEQSGGGPGSAPSRRPPQPPQSQPPTLSSPQNAHARGPNSAHASPSPQRSDLNPAAQLTYPPGYASGGARGVSHNSPPGHLHKAPGMPHAPGNSGQLTGGPGGAPPSRMAPTPGVHPQLPTDGQRQGSSPGPIPGGHTVPSGPGHAQQPGQQPLPAGLGVAPVGRPSPSTHPGRHHFGPVPQPQPTPTDSAATSGPRPSSPVRASGDPSSHSGPAGPSPALPTTPGAAGAAAHQPRTGGETNPSPAPNPNDTANAPGEAAPDASTPTPTPTRESMAPGRVVGSPTTTRGDSADTPEPAPSHSSALSGRLFRSPAPHRGWNDVAPTGDHYYFAHSAYVRVAHAKDILWTVDYQGLRFPAAVRHQTLFGCQFHPEQSQLVGLRFLRAFVLGSRS